MRSIILKSKSINDLPLWQAAREHRLRQLPLPARRLAIQHNMEPEIAALVAQLAFMNGESK